jgi:D-alanyl-D-alanine carboxypeptidase/D-alanyl-D-alanine-endopeptidase (penicillin-binding protein 4)
LPTAAALSAQVDAALADPVLGGRLAVSVVDVAAGEVLLERDAGTPLLPASTAKIVTSVAALTAVDPQLRLRTRVLAGPLPGDVVLVGGGDTMLASSREAVVTPGDARLDLLASRVAAVLGDTPLNRVLVDDTLYGGPVLGPGWRPTYVPEGHVAPVMALMVDGGRVRPDRRARSADPALAAGEAFAALVRPGAEVLRGTAAPGAAELASVDSAPVAALVERMLTTSDNDLAEALARQVALAQGAAGQLRRRCPGADVGVRAGARAARRRGGRRAPGRRQRACPATTCSRPARSPGCSPRSAAGDAGVLSPVLTGLPVAGFDGTLADRYRAGHRCRAPASCGPRPARCQGCPRWPGVVRTADGRLLAFALTADGVPSGGTRAAEAVLDRLAASFAAAAAADRLAPGVAWRRWPAPPRSTTTSPSRPPAGSRPPRRRSPGPRRRRRHRAARPRRPGRGARARRHRAWCLPASPRRRSSSTVPAGPRSTSPRSARSSSR